MCIRDRNRDELAARLRGACAAVTAAQDELTEIDSHFGDADVVYTDIWVSMGEPPEAWAERIDAMLPYHCLLYTSRCV